MTDDPFKSFAERYDAFGRDDPTILEFFGRLVEKYDLKSVLDCACGTGDDIILLHSLGLDVTGSDISSAMLQVAQKKLSAHNIDIPLVRVDFRYLRENFNREFDAIFCMSTSLPQLREKKEILKALKSMYDILKPGGILVLSQGMSDRQYSFRHRFIPVINTPEFSRIMVIDYFEHEWEVHVLDIIHTSENCDFKTSRFRYRTMLCDDYEKLLKEAGFSSFDFLGNSQFDPYDKNTSGQLIVIAKM